MKLSKVFVGRRRKLFAWLVLNGLVQATLGLAAVVVFERFHASGFSQGSWVAILMGLAGCVYASRVLQRRHGEMFALDYVNETRLALLEKLLSLSDTARGASIGLMTTRLSADLLALKSWLSEGLANSIVQGVTLAMMLAGATFLYPRVAVILACVIIPWFVAVALLRPPLAEAIGVARKQRGRLASMAGDQVVSRLTLAHFGRTTPSLDAISHRATLLSKALIRRVTFSESMRATMEWALPIASLGALWMLSGGSGTAVPAATPLLLLLGMTSSLLAGLSRSIDLHAAHQLAAERFSAAFDAPSVASSPFAVEPGIRRGQPVELHLQWTDATGAVTNHSVPPGSVLSLVGGTDHQRSGLLAAVARLRDDPRLTTSIADLPATAVTVRDWRRIVTLSSPRLPLIRDTIVNNLSIGAPSKTLDESVLDLARRFGIATNLKDMKVFVEPTHVPVQQALAMRLCRSLIRNASIILLDEVTTASDTPTITLFLELAKQRGVTIITSGRVIDESGLPVGEPLQIPLELPLLQDKGTLADDESRIPLESDLIDGEV